MSTFTKYNIFAEDLANKVHDLFGTAGSGADTLKIMLSNTAPNASTHAVRADSSELSGGNGYTSGGNAVTNVGTRSTATVNVASASTVTFTASGGAIGPFQYLILYNDTPTSPADPLIGWWDYGSSITLADGETLTGTVATPSALLSIAVT
jgi:hypothetical protein